MGEFLDNFKNKKNLISLLLLGILTLAIPLAVGTLRQQQIIKSRAAGDPIKFVGDNVRQKSDGTWVALKSPISLELTSPLGLPVQTSTQTVQSKNSLLSLLPKGLAGTVYADSQCPDDVTYCDTATGKSIHKHGGVAELSGCRYAFDIVGDCGGGGGSTGSRGSCVYSQGTQCYSGNCLDANNSCSFNVNCGYVPGVSSGDSAACPGSGGSTDKISSESDGKGGCCTLGAQPNSFAGCRQDSSVVPPMNEVCDIANGACASGKSCRSQTSSGCGRNSDCGPGNYCAGGICKSGESGGKCESATSLEARFSVNGNLQDKATIALGQTVIAAVYRSGLGQFAGSKVNNEYTPTDVSASIKGPAGVSVPTLNLAQGTNFTPTQPGTYVLTATCGNNVTGQATLTVTGTAVTLPPGGGTCSLPSPSITDACASCIKSQPGRGNLPTEVKNLGVSNGQSWSSCTDSQLISQWCTGVDVNSCNNYKTAACASACGGTTVTTTVSFRVAENPTDLAAASWQTYTTVPMPWDYTFKDLTPGQKTIFVEFKDSTGKIERKSAQIRLLGADPAITSCALSFEGNNTVLNLKGQNFGSVKGNLKSNDQNVDVKEWKDTSIKAVRPNTPEGETVTVSLTNSDGQTIEGQCGAISQLALGARVFCRAPSSHDTDNVDLTLAGIFEGGTKNKQKVKIDKDGVIQGLTQKLEDGKKYKLSLKAPRSLRRTTVEFTAGGGITNIPNFVLPVGDISPADGGDGKINAFDKSELNTQWIISRDATGRSADFNKDSRVNSIDWACMRVSMPDAVSGDDPEPVPGVPAPTSLSNPANVTSSCNASGQATVSWNQAEGATNYSLRFNKTPANDWRGPGDLILNVGSINAYTTGGSTLWASYKSSDNLEHCTGTGCTNSDPQGTKTTIDAGINYVVSVQAQKVVNGQLISSSSEVRVPNGVKCP